jgi:hypothetical protein
LTKTLHLLCIAPGQSGPGEQNLQIEGGGV